MPSYQHFRQSDRGRRVADLAATAAGAMARLSDRAEPAIAAIDHDVAEQVGQLGHTERQHAGRIVRDVLAPLGWEPLPQRKRLQNGRVFTSGAVYARTGTPTGGGGAGDPVALRLTRADEAVTLLARSRTGDAGTIDEFVADRRAEARRDERGR